MSFTPPALNDLMAQFFGGEGSLTDAQYAFYKSALDSGYTAATLIPFPTYLQQVDPDEGQAEIQNGSPDPIPDGGTVKFVFAEGTTDDIDFDASNGDINDAVEAVTGPAVISVTGDLTTALTFTWNDSGVQVLTEVADNELVNGVDPSVLEFAVSQPGIDPIDVADNATWGNSVTLRVWRNDAWQIITGD